jgi:4-carboxymuconolactone decarboxylase
MTRMTLVDKIPDEALEPAMQTNLGRALYNNPELCIAFKALASGVHRDSHLEPRLREMVVLRVSAELKSDVEWGQHFRIATTPMVYGTVSITVAEARDVRDGKLDGFPLKERVAMEYAIAFDRNAVDDEAWAGVSEHFTPLEVLDLTMLAGLYGLAGRLTNGLAVPMDDGILPISAVDSLI